MTRGIVEQGKVVNVGVNSFKDPANSSGLYISAFSLYQTYRVDRSRVKQICESLYEHLIEQISRRNLGDARFRVVTYREDSMEFSQISANEYDNEERTYVLITRNTLRSTRATILVRFLTYGDNLYVGVDTYVLGKLNLFAFILKIFLTIVIPWLAIAPLSFFPGLNVLLWLLYLCLIAFSWRGLIQRIQQVGDLRTSLRLEFNKSLDLGSFNLDDVVMFVKSTLHATVTSIRETFEREGLPVESLYAFVQSINVNNINQNFTGSVGGVTATGSVNLNTSVQK